MIAYHIYSSYKDLPETWNSITEHDIFLKTSYFKAIEEASPDNIQFFYVGVFKNDVLVGVALIQCVQLYLKDMFRKTQVSCIKELFQNIVSKVLKGNILVVGNLMHTGQHGMFYDNNKISQRGYLNNIFEALNVLKDRIKKIRNKTIRIVVLKDFFETDSIYTNTDFFLSQKLHNTFVQPNMIMSIKSDWLKMEDYVASLNKKYRSRYKRAKKKLGTITCLELSVNTIEKHSETLYQLYLNVSNNAKFNTFILPEKHFYNLKLQLKSNFKVFGYYLNDELIGFYTLILNNNNLETYFLGYDTRHQYPNQLYLNMLYDMAKFGIENKFSKIIYARTAMAIKSSVGAKPRPMHLYLKHTNGFMNIILKHVFKLMNPSQDWEERHPFKI